MFKRVSLAIGTFIAGITSAIAAVPLAATTALTEVQTDGLALIDLVWPVVGAVTAGFILLKLFKRGANKV